MADIVTSQNPEAVQNTPCKICRRQFSKYTCPKCNIPYCSLTCFRATTHDQCSEGFYREEVQTDIKTAATNTAEERLQMMEMLKRFEESSLEDEENDGEDEFSERLGGVDLDAISSEELWELLSEEQREKFVKALQVPSSGLAQQLLASEELEQDRREPWWKEPDDGERPGLMDIPPTLLKANPPPGPSLLYNICALCISYAYVNRYFATSPLSKATGDDIGAMCQIFSQLVPFLVDRKSKAIHPTLSSAITDVWSRLEQDKVSSEFFSILLEDASSLLRPRIVTEVPAGQLDYKVISHSSLATILALSDIALLFHRVPHVVHKLTFYVVHLMSIPPALVNAVADDMVARSKTIGVKAESPGTFTRVPPASQPLIQEM